MKKIVALVLALVMVMAFSSAALADQYGTWSSTILTTYFYTSQQITRDTGYVWDAYTYIDVDSISSSGTTRIKCTPVDGSNRAIGATVTFTGVSTKSSWMSDIHANVIKLKIENDNGGTNIQSTGTWESPQKYYPYD